MMSISPVRRSECAHVKIIIIKFSSLDGSLLSTPTRGMCAATLLLLISLNAL